MTIWVAPNYRDTCPCKTKRRGYRDAGELPSEDRGRDGSDAATIQGTPGATEAREAEGPPLERGCLGFSLLASKPLLSQATQCEAMCYPTPGKRTQASSLMAYG